MREDSEAESADRRLAARLASLRAEHGWSLDELSGLTGLSRSTLSRVERGELSPTAASLGRLCAAYGRTMSRLLMEVEAEPPLLVPAGDQQVWYDASVGFTRRSVSPPHPGLRGEIVEGTLDPGATISYENPPVPGMEQHLWVREGVVGITVDGTTHTLGAGDCLRFRLRGPSRFHCPGPERTRYVLIIVMP
ncbi:helix-turn-helix domain-containing protein [Streptomyces sp. NPDC060184]|uniref:helix-turn-helix domain-containing protein n=1 Tax=Streptomyces sp. NPDC060184 TaxID=3347064 RepID=UPI00364960D2